MARKIVHSAKIDVKKVVCGKVIVMIFSINFLIRYTKNLFMPDSGSEVNGLEQSLKYF